MYTPAEYAAAWGRVRSDIASAFPEQALAHGDAILEYCTARTNLDSADLTAEQAAWKALYEGVKEQETLNITVYIDNRERIAQLESRLSAGPPLTVQQAFEMRRDIASKTNLNSDDLTARARARKLLHQGLTNALCEAAPDMMAHVEPIEEEMRNVENLKRLIEASMAAHPHDQGFRVAYAGLVIGAVIGWIRTKAIESVLLDGIMGGLAGVFCSILFLDSPHVQSVSGIAANRIGLKRLGHWLYSRSLGFRLGNGRVAFVILFVLYTVFTAWAFLGSLEVISGDALIPRIPWLYSQPRAGCLLCLYNRDQYVFGAQRKSGTKMPPIGFSGPGNAHTSSSNTGPAKPEAEAGRPLVIPPPPQNLPPFPALPPVRLKPPAQDPYTKASTRFDLANYAHDNAMLWELWLGTGLHVIAAVNVLLWVILLIGMPAALRADISNTRIAPR
jgi:hypothetical protein